MELCRESLREVIHEIFNYRENQACSSYEGLRYREITAHTTRTIHKNHKDKTTFTPLDSNGYNEMINLHDHSFELPFSHLLKFVQGLLPISVCPRKSVKGSTMYAWANRTCTG